MNGWPEAIARLRSRTGVAPALAAAGVLAAARPDWEHRVVVATAGNDLLLTRPGDAYPFSRDVRVSLVGRAFEVRQTGPAPQHTTVTAADVDDLLASCLEALLGGDSD